MTSAQLLRPSLLLATATFAFSTWAQQVPGVTPDTIRIGMFGTLSGPNAVNGFDGMNGARMYYAEVNKKGGINGRKIELVVEDDRCSPNDAVASVKKLVESDNVFMIHGGTCSGPTVATKDYVVRAKIPMVFVNAAGDGALYPPEKYIFGALGSSQHSQGGGAIDFVGKHLKAKKVAYIAHDDAYGKWGFEAAEFQARKLGGIDLQPYFIDPNVTDVTALMLKVRVSNPDAIVSMVYVRPSALVLRKASELGIKTPILQSANGSLSLKQLVDTVAEPGAWNNVYLQDTLADLPDSPKMKWITDLYAQYYPDLAKMPDHPSILLFQGVNSAMVVTEALKRSGRDLTRDKLLATLDNFKLDAGIVAGPVEFTPTKRAGQDATAYYKFDGKSRTRAPGTYASAWQYGVK